MLGKKFFSSDFLWTLYIYFYVQQCLNVSLREIEHKSGNMSETFTSENSQNVFPSSTFRFFMRMNLCRKQSWVRRGYFLCELIGANLKDFRAIYDICLCEVSLVFWFKKINSFKVFCNKLLWSSYQNNSIKISIFKYFKYREQENQSLQRFFNSMNLDKYSV